MKNLIKYLKGTLKEKLTFKKKSKNEGKKIELEIQSDASHATIPPGKSVSGTMVKMDGNLILWNSKKQSIVTTCANEAEYV